MTDTPAPDESAERVLTLKCGCEYDAQGQAAECVTHLHERLERVKAFVAYCTSADEARTQLAEAREQLAESERRLAAVRAWTNNPTAYGDDLDQEGPIIGYQQAQDHVRAIVDAS